MNDDQIKNIYKMLDYLRESNIRVKIRIQLLQALIALLFTMNLVTLILLLFV